MFMKYFTQRLDSYEKVLDVLDGIRSHPCFDAEYASISHVIQTIHDEIASLKTNLEKTIQLVSKEKEQLSAIESLKKRMAHLKNNCHLFAEHENEQEMSSCVQDSSVKPPLQDITNHSIYGVPLPSHDNNKSMDTTTKSFFASTPVPLKTPQTRKDLEIAISYISNSEFLSVPQYMLGRLRFEEINAFIDVFNSALNEKFALLEKPKRLLKKKKDQDLVLYWKESEIPELKDQHYLTAQDFVSLKNLKLSKKDFSIITVLRHVQRVKEVRIKKLCYYVARFC